MAKKKEETQWITVGGKHIPLKYRGDNESKTKEPQEEDAIKEQINRDEDRKERQIRANKEQAEKLNAFRTPAAHTKKKDNKKKPVKKSGSGSGISLPHKQTGHGANALASGIARSALQSGTLQELSKQGSAATNRNQSKGKGDDTKGAKYDEMNKKKKGRK